MAPLSFEQDARSFASNASASNQLLQGTSSASFIRAATASFNAKTSAPGREIEKLPADGDAPPAGLSEYEAVLTIVLMCFGVGLAVLPRAVSEAGYIITPFLMVLCSVACFEQNRIVSHGCEIAEELTGEPVTSFEDLAQVSGGPHWVVMLRMSKAFGLLSAVATFIQFATGNTLALATEIFGSSSSGDPRAYTEYVRFLFIMPMVIGLAMLKDLKAFAKISSIGVFAAAINGGAIVWGGITRWFIVPACDSESAADEAGECIRHMALPTQDDKAIVKIGMAASVCLFGIMVAGSYPSTRHQMQNKQAIRGVGRVSFALTLIIFVSVMLGGYVGIGQAVQDNALDSYTHQPLVRYVGQFAQIVDTLVASPIYILCVVNALETSGTGGWHTPLSPLNVLLRAGLVVTFTSLSSLVPYPEIICIEATFFGIFTHLVWPIFLNTMLTRKWIEAGKDPALVRVSAFRTMLRWGIMIFGLTVGCFSIYGAAGSIKERMSSGA